MRALSILPATFKRIPHYQALKTLCALFPGCFTTIASKALLDQFARRMGFTSVPDPVEANQWILGRLRQGGVAAGFPSGMKRGYGRCCRG
jgi:hypothetical protein